MYPKVTAIIVNYNGEEYLRKCFHSIVNQDYPIGRLQIIVVDNASKDASVSYIKNNYKSVNVIDSGGNLGYSGGANVGYKHATGDYVALMANDMIFPKKWVKEMVGSFEKDKTIAAVTSTMINVGEKREEGELLNASPILVGRTDTKKSGYTIVPWGGACMFRKNLFKLPFDSEYFIYGEDIYLGLLSWLRGYKLVENKIKVIHFGSITVGFFSKIQVHYNERNRLINILSFFKWKTIFLLSPLIIADILIKTIYFLSINRPDLVDAEKKAIFWNIKNLNKVLIKRRAIQKQRKVGDFTLLNIFCENIYGEGGFKRAFNILSTGYFQCIKKFYRKFNF